MSPQLTLGPPLSFENLGCGAAEEMFEDTLHKVLENILDPNTSWKTTREITLKVKIKPSEQRDAASVLIDCVPKLAPQKSFATAIFIGQAVGGAAEAHEVNANQFSLFPTTKDNVAAIGGGDGKL